MLYMCNSEYGLEQYCDHWDDIIAETVDELGERDAFHIHEVHIQNWISVIEWLQAEGEFKETAVIERFTQLFNELRWVHFLFLVGNYRTVYWKLRYMMEIVIQAYDIHEQSQGEDCTLDEQMAGAAAIEEARYSSDMRGLIVAALDHMLDDEKEDIEAWFEPLWTLMNKHIHPSPKEMHVIADRDPAALYWDSFDEQRAVEVLLTTNAIGDIILWTMFEIYPELVDRATESDPFMDTLEMLPYTAEMVSKGHKSGV